MSEPNEREQELRERPLGEVLRQATDDATTLIRQEVALAKSEVADKGKQLGAGAGMLGGAAVGALAAVGAFTACLILVLDLWMPGWLAALIVTVLWAVVAYALVTVGRNRIKAAAPAVPTETAENVKEDVQWLKEQSSSARK